MGLGNDYASDSYLDLQTSVVIFPVFVLGVILPWTCPGLYDTSGLCLDLPRSI